jgi:hypothetical protein
MVATRGSKTLSSWTAEGGDGTAAATITATPIQAPADMAETPMRHLPRTLAVATAVRTITESRGCLPESGV